MTKIHTWDMKTLWLLNDSDLDGSGHISFKKKKKRIWSSYRYIYFTTKPNAKAQLCYQRFQLVSESLKEGEEKLETLPL